MVDVQDRLEGKWNEIKMCVCANEYLNMNIE